MMEDFIVIKQLIKNLFGSEINKTISISHMVRDTKFDITLKEEGIYVPKLEKGEKIEGDLEHKGLIKWEIFYETIEFLKQNPGKKAVKGSAQGGKLLNECSDFNIHNVEGYIAHKCYNVKFGEKSVRRVTYYGAILVEAGLVNNEDKYIKLNQKSVVRNLDIKSIKTTLTLNDLKSIEILLDKYINKITNNQVKENIEILKERVAQTITLQNDMDTKEKLNIKLDELLKQQIKIEENRNKDNSIELDEKIIMIALEIAEIRRKLQRI